MRKTIYNVIVVVSIILSTVIINAQPIIQRLEDDHFKITFQNIDSDSIRILQVTDLHMGSKGYWQDDLRTYNRIKRLVKMYDPHLIFVTGDLFTGDKPYGSLLAAYAVHFFDELQRPWFYVYGNHDPQGGFGHDDIYNVFKTSEWGVLGYHGADKMKKYDYYVDIIVGDNSTPNWQVYAFDTGPHNGIKAVQPDQIEWYKEISKQTKEKYNSTIRAISIFHIPLIQYQELWNDDSIKKGGVSLEKVYYEEDDGALYNTFVEMGNVKAVIDLPEELYLSLSASGLTREKIANESRKLLALKCFKEKILSLGQSAELSGLSKWDFIEFLGENDVPVVNYDQDEIKRELDVVDKLSKKLKN